MSGLSAALLELRRTLDQEMFPLKVGDTASDRHALKELAGQLDDYLLPRLAALDAPLLAVVGGSTGAGKSTLVNSLVGAEVTEAGVLRPTTLAPTLVVHPADAGWFSGTRVLPGLPRSTGGGRAEAGTLRLVTAETVPSGLALLDAPDIDSVVKANRDLAAQLLAAADLWLFCTTAARYADDVPWGFLRRARDRSTALAVILQRVPAEASGPVGRDLRRLLEENGLGPVPLFEIPELRLPENGALLPETAAGPVRRWLEELSADARTRAAVVHRTLAGSIDSLDARVRGLADSVERQRLGARELADLAESAYTAGLTAFDDGMRDGSLLRSEVLARWQDFVGTGDLMRGLESRVGRLRDRVVAAFTGRPLAERELTAAMANGVEALIGAVADGAAERTVDAWLATPAGRALLEDEDVAQAGRLGRASPRLQAGAERAVREWQGFVLDLVRREGASRRGAARAASFGVNGLGLLLMVGVFASTGGLSGLEIGIAGGTGVVGQKLLEAVFGDQAVRRLTGEARSDLAERVRVLLAQDRGRFTVLLSPTLEADPGRLRAVAGTIRAHRGELSGGGAK
ncbi:GTPase domain-containing protein [Actinocorallia longicatena]|uniref:Dynamin family protein n=1 Tax=Actinocorallia longicatena TaxID=111803 RepID=A0ABP6PZ40_9ACTN